MLVITFRIMPRSSRKVRPQSWVRYLMPPAFQRLGSAQMISLMLAKSYSPI